MPGKVGSSGRVADLSVKTGRDRAGQHAYLAKTKANAVAGSDSETPPSQDSGKSSRSSSNDGLDTQSAFPSAAAGARSIRTTRIVSSPSPSSADDDEKNPNQPAIALKPRLEEISKVFDGVEDALKQDNHAALAIFVPLRESLSSYITNSNKKEISKLKNDLQTLKDYLLGTAKLNDDNLVVEMMKKQLKAVLDSVGKEDVILKKKWKLIGFRDLYPQGQVVVTTEHVIAFCKEKETLLSEGNLISHDCRKLNLFIELTKIAETHILTNEYQTQVSRLVAAREIRFPDLNITPPIEYKVPAAQKANHPRVEGMLNGLSRFDDDASRYRDVFASDEKGGPAPGDTKLCIAKKEAVDAWIVNKINEYGTAAINLEFMNKFKLELMQAANVICQQYIDKQNLITIPSLQVPNLKADIQKKADELFSKQNGAVAALSASAKAAMDVILDANKPSKELNQTDFLKKFTIQLSPVDEAKMPNVNLDAELQKVNSADNRPELRRLSSPSSKKQAGPVAECFDISMEEVLRFIGRVETFNKEFADYESKLKKEIEKKSDFNLTAIQAKLKADYQLIINDEPRFKERAAQIKEFYRVASDEKASDQSWSVADKYFEFAPKLDSQSIEKEFDSYIASLPCLDSPNISAVTLRIRDIKQLQDNSNATLKGLEKQVARVEDNQPKLVSHNSKLAALGKSAPEIIRGQGNGKWSAAADTTFLYLQEEGLQHTGDDNAFLKWKMRLAENNSNIRKQIGDVKAITLEQLKQESKSLQKALDNSSEAKQKVTALQLHRKKFIDTVEKVATDRFNQTKLELTQALKKKIVFKPSAQSDEPKRVLTDFIGTLTAFESSSALATFKQTADSVQYQTNANDYVRIEQDKRAEAARQAEAARLAKVARLAAEEARLAAKAKLAEDRAQRENELREQEVQKAKALAEANAQKRADELARKERESRERAAAIKQANEAILIPLKVTAIKLQKLASAGKDGNDYAPDEVSFGNASILISKITGTDKELANSLNAVLRSKLEVVSGSFESLSRRIAELSALEVDIRKEVEQIKRESEAAYKRYIADLAQFQAELIRGQGRGNVQQVAVSHSRQEQKHEVIPRTGDLQRLLPQAPAGRPGQQVDQKKEAQNRLNALARSNTKKDAFEEDTSSLFTKMRHTIADRMDYGIALGSTFGATGGAIVGGVTGAGFGAIPGAALGFTVGAFGGAALGFIVGGLEAIIRACVGGYPKQVQKKPKNDNGILNPHDSDNDDDLEASAAAPAIGRMSTAAMLAGPANSQSQALFSASLPSSPNTQAQLPQPPIVPGSLAAAPQATFASSSADAANQKQAQQNQKPQAPTLSTYRQSTIQR